MYFNRVCYVRYLGQIYFTYYSRYKEYVPVDVEVNIPLTESLYLFHLTGIL